MKIALLKSTLTGTAYILAAMLFLFILLPESVIAGPPLETETARLLKAGVMEVEGAFEFQTLKEGKELHFRLNLNMAVE